VVIAHRLSTIRHCNRVIYLRDGHVAADGTYDELAALGLINGVAREAGCPMPKLEMLEAELRFLEAEL
jgi:ABC-type multidrug transport system ATPase subunit